VSTIDTILGFILCPAPSFEWSPAALNWAALKVVSMYISSQGWNIYEILQNNKQSFWEEWKKDLLQMEYRLDFPLLHIEVDQRFDHWLQNGAKICKKHVAPIMFNPDAGGLVANKAPKHESAVTRLLFIKHFLLICNFP